ncbi:AIM24 family protein [Tundrisphaera sp. TA3]|uniref:AIM24 family protein n=1 Tax=Tundrisphaera sp. TA3 TaxID=3435775 RepID=UPI003EB936B8
MAAEWRFRIMGTVFGPVSVADLVRQAAEGRIGPDTEVRKGDGPWILASKVAGLFDRAAQARPAAPDPPGPAEEASVFVPAPRRPSSAAPSGGNFEVIDMAEADGFRVEVLAYSGLGGSRDPQTASTLYFAERAGIRLKQVRITLDGGEAIAESGALHFMLGRIQMESKIGGVAGLGKAMMNRFVAKEAAILPRYRGTGQIYLEPSFGHFLIHRLAAEEVIADKGMFYCGQGTLDVGAAIQKNVSSALFGGEGLFQTRIRGTGICVLESPVPAGEIVRVDLKDEALQVDGNFALMRTGRIEFSVEKSTRSILGTITGGEGLLQTFRGTGSVWLAPTQEVYQRLQAGGLGSMSSASRSSNTST